MRYFVKLDPGQNILNFFQFSPNFDFKAHFRWYNDLILTVFMIVHYNIDLPLI